ncbi:MAG: hypothetical protein KKI02_04335 [Planctomycetes bacterium]|nr:hypothetical protein [Planctomycetota bacterium]
MSAIDRADQDVQHGDYGMARIRLASYLNTKGYDPALLSRLGQLSYDMRDLAQAGRYWMTSSAEGENVESAIKAFLRHTGNDPFSIAAQLPPAVRQIPPDSLPGVARARVQRFGLKETLERAARAPRKRRSAARGKIVTVTGGAVGLLVVLLMITIFVVGLTVIVGWLFW